MTLVAPPADIQVRHATLDDLDGVIDLRALCYPYKQSNYDWLRNRFVTNPRFTFDEDVMVAVHHGKVVANLTMVPFETFAPGGLIIPMRGIASVAVSPLYRRQGVAKLLLQGALEAIAAEATPISGLFPFEYSFYARHGWANVAKACVYKMPPKALPLFEDRAGIRVLGPEDIPAIAACHQAYHQGRGALAVMRDVAVWEEKWGGYNLQAFGYPATGALEGICCFEFDSAAAIPLQQDLIVREFAALTPEAYRGLIGILAAMQEQVRLIVFATTTDDPFPLLWQEQRRPEAPMVRGEDFPIGEVTSSFMLRITDLPMALVSRGYPPITGALGIHCVDPELPGNAVPVTLRLHEGDPHVEVNRVPADGWIKTDVGTLSQLWCGAVSASDAACWGRLEASSPKALAWADMAFRTQNQPYLPDFDAY